MKFVWKDDVYNGDGYYDVPGVRFEIQKNGEKIEENSYPMFGGKLDIYLNRIAQKYLAGGTLDFTSGVTQHPDMCGVFTLVRRSGHQAIVKEEKYVYAFDGEPTPYLSNPINGKLDPRMNILWSAFLEEGQDVDIDIVKKSFFIALTGSMDFGFEQQSRDLALAACSDWSVVSASTNSDWFTVVKTNTGITINVDTNLELSARTGYFDLCWEHPDYETGCNTYQVYQYYEDGFVIRLSGSTDFTFENQNRDIDVSLCTDWSVVSASTTDNWLNVVKTNTGITLSVNKNTGDIPRTGSFSLCWNKEGYEPGCNTYEVIQDKAHTFVVNISGSTDFDYLQQSRELQLIDCTDWSVVSASTSNNWINLTKTNTGITISVTENEGNNRTGSFSLCWSKQGYETGCNTYQVIQNQANEFVLILSGSTDFDYLHQTRELELVECTDWSVVSANTTYNWINVTKTDTGITLTVNDNISASARTGSFSLCWYKQDYRTGCNNYQVVQDKEHFNATFSGITSYPYSATSGLIYYSATTEPEIVSYPSWITNATVVPNVGAENTGIIEFTMSESTSSLDRSGNIVIRRKNFAYGETARCSITQIAFVERRYLTLKTISARSSVRINGDYNVNYRVNGGEWHLMGNNFVDTVSGDTVEWKLTNGSSGITFSASTEVDSKVMAYGNIMSLGYGDNFYGKSSLNKAYRRLFSGFTALVYAEDLILPATTLTGNCYQEMFYNCTSLVTAPKKLPATALTSYCYYAMFNGCRSLTTAPELPGKILGYQSYYAMFQGCTSLVTAPEISATSLANECCYYMFRNCTSLVNAPSILPAMTLSKHCYRRMFMGCTSLVNGPSLSATSLEIYCCEGMFSGCTSLVNVTSILPAMTLTEGCYTNMFNGCSSLVNAPELPATTLAQSCYGNMFYGCSSLVTAPSLPATALTNSCYYQMFYNCPQINYIKCMAANGIGQNSATGAWLYNTSETGTFIKKRGVSWPSGTSGIPNGWTIVEADN